MSIKRFLAAFAMAAGLCAPAAAAPLEAYGHLPTIEQIALSPGGGSVAFVVTDGEHRVIAIKDLATGAIIRENAGAAKVRYLRWAGDRHVIIVVSVTSRPPMDVTTSQREWMTAYDLDLQTKTVQPVLKNLHEEALNSIYDVPVVRERDGVAAVYVQGVQFVDHMGVLSLFRIDLDRARVTVAGLGSEHTTDWVVGADGEPVAQEMYNAGTGRWSIRLKTKNAGWRDVATTTALVDRPSVLGLGRDGKSVMYEAVDDKAKGVWREARLDDAPPADPLDIADGQSAVHDPADGRLIGIRTLVGDERRYTFFDPADARVWSAVTKAFPGDMVTLVSWSRDRKKIVVRVDSLKQGPAFALVDLNTRQATWLGVEYGDVKEQDIAPQTPIRFKARDGLPLSGYLTLPKAREPKGLPLIVFPHGGPAARDEPGFDWWAQAMASRGYAVLQVNFRGSAGYGDDLLEAGYGQWGRKMQTDLSDGVKHLAEQGLIDPKRVCIVGASYGGYAALAGAAFDPGVYRCAASYGGLSDMRRFVEWAKAAKGKEAFRYLNRFMGSENAHDPVLAELSPAAHVDRISIPVLLVHGKDDSVVPLEQSQIMADALKKAGKPVELVVEPGEDHWLSRGETRLQMLQATMAFVEKYNPPN